MARFWCIAFVVGSLAMGSLAHGDEPVFNPQPVPAMQVLPLPNYQASFQHQGRELAGYHHAPWNRRPFFYPLVGPSGRSLTRMGHPRDPIGHIHHNSMWISHHDINGVGFWNDNGTGRIVHKRMELLDDADAGAVLVALNHWIDESADPPRLLLEERRRVEVRPLPDDEFLMLIDLELSAPTSAATVGQTPFGFIGVRMAKTIGVRDGGGRILNADGAVNEKEVFWKPTRWCDYAGASTATHTEGISLFDHPSNLNHPNEFHVRDDGWMGACCTFNQPHVIEPGQPLRLRYGLYVHAGVPNVDTIDAHWQTFAAEQPPAALLPAKRP